MSDGQTGLRGLLAQHDALEARPQNDTGQRRDESGHHPAAHAGRNRRSGCRDGDRDHEGEEHAGLRRSHVAAEDPAEGDRQTDDEHHGGRQSSRDRYQRADRDQQCADSGGRQVGERPRRPLTTEIRHDEEGETTKDGEDDVLPTVEDKDGECQDRRNDNGGAGRAPERGEPRIGRRRKRETGSSRRSRRLGAGDIGSAGSHLPIRTPVG